MEVLRNSTLGNVFREDAIEERPKGNEGVSHLDTRSFQAEGTVKISVRKIFQIGGSNQCGWYRMSTGA